MAALRGIVAEMLAAEGDDPDYVELDRRLHSAIAAGTRNRFFVRFFEAIEETFVAYSHRVIDLPGPLLRAAISPSWMDSSSTCAPPAARVIFGWGTSPTVPPGG